MKQPLPYPIVLFFIVLNALAQKQAYIPLYIQDNTTPEGSQFTWDKTAQSDNFTLIWGNTVGTDPASYTIDPQLTFNPQTILATMEMLYTEYKALGFLDDATGTNLSLYKIPVIMYGTWGADVAQGYANGGGADGVIGAFWVHPVAMQTGDVAAHELTHSLQAQCIIDYRNQNSLGPVWNHSGIFWETHANFMRNLIYPQDVSAWGMDVYHTEIWGDWKNTYENYHLLFGIMENDGIEMVNNLWRNSYSDEYPLQAYKRLGGYAQAEFNSVMFSHIRRMATMDFSYNNLGDYLRQYRSNDLQNWLPTIQCLYSILDKVDGASNQYEIPIEQAPEEYAYNIIPLYPEEGECSVRIKFKGHTEANIHAGWRYGFAGVKADGTIGHYSETYSSNTGAVAFSLEGDEIAMYLIIMGAPADGITISQDNDTWHGYPKHYRFPYALTILGAVPEGYQNAEQFRAPLKQDGHIHSNGGGWVQNSATVAASVYVGPTAIVLGNAELSGNVRIEGTAIVRDATMSGSAKVQDNAVISGGTYMDNAVVRGRAYVENAFMNDNAVVGMRARVSNYNLSGSIEVGGDVVAYNAEGNCDNGVYYKMTNYYEDNLFACDGRTAAHPENSDVNNIYSVFNAQAMAFDCDCDAMPTCLTLGLNALRTENTVFAYPNPASDIMMVNILEGDWDLRLYDILGVALDVPVTKTETGYTIRVSTIAEGAYIMFLKANDEKVTVKIIVRH